jgi:predicted transcriptional regulator
MGVLWPHQASRRYAVAIIHIRVSQHLKDRVDRIRAEEKRSLRAVVEIALEHYCRDAESRKDPRHEAA